MYLIVWSATAFDEMQGYITRHPTRRAAMAAALRSVTDRLAVRPNDEGESREEGIRVIHTRPLTVYFRVDEPARTVEVARVVLVG